jgi:hypothetical protein
MKFFEFVEKFVLFLVSCHMFSAFAGVWGGVGVGIDLVLAESLRVLGRFGPGLSPGLSLGLVSDLATRFFMSWICAHFF